MTIDIIDDYEIPRQRARPRRSGLPGGAQWKNQDFQCIHCHYPVSAQVIYAGVHNRNHCPYCLWSKHMDLYQAGDRLAVCKCAMVPLGLTLKHTHKKYASVHPGELMLVHQCVECGKLSINRIAADDDDENLAGVFETSLRIDPETRGRIAAQGIRLLDAQDGWLVFARLKGCEYNEVGIGSFA